MSQSPTNENHKEILKRLKPSLDASIDPICLIGSNSEIIHMNQAMRSLLNLRGKRKSPAVLQNILSLKKNGKDVTFANYIKRDIPIRMDESAATISKTKVRVVFRLVPVHDTEKKPVAAVVTLRDSSAEVVLQAKYLKAIRIIRQRDKLLAELQTRINRMKRSLRESFDQRK